MINDSMRSSLARKAKIMETIIKYKIKGYSYDTAKKWGRKVYFDLKYDNGKSIKEKKWAHRHGFLSKSIGKYNLNDNNYKDFFSDFEYNFIMPINNQYEKWLTDRLTPYYILKPFKNSILPTIYYSVIRRNGVQKIISLNDNKNVEIKDVINFLKLKKEFILMPSQSSHSRYSYLFQYKNEKFYVNSERISTNQIYAMFSNLKSYYVIRERITTKPCIKEMFDGREVVFKFILSNQEMRKSEIISSYIEFVRPYIGGRNTKKRFGYKDFKHILVDEKTGIFRWKKGEVIYCESMIPNWQEMCKEIIEISSYMSEIEYMMLSIKLTEDGIKLVGHGRMPQMPEGTKADSGINIYLKNKFKQKKAEKNKIRVKSFYKARILKFLKKHFFRRGFRDYMLATWLDTIKKDAFQKGVSIRKKIWAWKRGFPSYRIEQYGLNESNYNNFLSDYDYAWLNRINNTYQKWINDKTSMRYVLDPVKQYLPEYYFFVGKRGNRVCFKKLQDCPINITPDIEGVYILLNEKKKLVFKPNAGLHGDGFYKIEKYGDNIMLNDKLLSFNQFRELLLTQNSTYVITDYIEMHNELRKIYDKSVNTIRIMVLNPECDNPKIVQAYMRMGTTNTGVTDNIAFGGIAVHVDKENGFFHDAELLLDHKYVPITKHPDTEVKIEGILPNWEIVKKGVIEVSKRIPQIEYLGYDIAITEEGFKILEINIHQDLHKAHEFSEEINVFFDNKLNYKRRIYGIN